jgi:hypothetical protein
MALISAVRFSASSRLSWPERIRAEQAAVDVELSAVEVVDDALVKVVEVVGAARLGPSSNLLPYKGTNSLTVGEADVFNR